ncbi:MAG: tRNA (adenosine(37)-N6)-threonylcarbamoyltransferase complex ATPase subunit type 1 TsaE [Ginsengibacter sp.]
MEIIYNLNEIRKVAKKLVSVARDYKIITFSGELGAGKTTLIIEICKELGVTEVVSSPTFAIIQQYNLDNHNLIYHMDLYRLKDSREAIEAGIEDCLLSNELCLVEWPENARSLFPNETVQVLLQVLSADERKLVVQLPQ